MKKFVTTSIAAALMSVAAGAYAQETQQASIEFTYGSNDCRSGGICKARPIPTPPEHFMVHGLSIRELDRINELINIRSGQDIPAYTFVRMRNTPS